MSAVGAVFTLLIIIAKKKGAFKRDYDERQHIARGKAFRAAYLTLLGYFLIDQLFQTITGIEWGQRFVDISAGVFVSALVFASSCIWNDAYLSFRDNRRITYACFIIIFTGNLLTGISTSARGQSMVTDGKLNIFTCNYMAAAVCAAILGVLLVKNIAENKRKQEDPQ